MAVQSLFNWLHRRWQSYDGGNTYSHSYFIPFISLFAVYRLWPQLKEAARGPDAIGGLFFAGSLLLHWLGMRCYLPRLSVLSLIGMTWSIPYFIYGGRVARLLIFPCSYLLLCIPLTFLDSLAWNLRFLMSFLSSAILNGIGIESARSGTAIFTDTAGGFGFDIADPCSGLRSFLALVSLSGAYAYFSMRSNVKRWILFLTAAPIAVLSNMVRILSIALVALVGGKDIAMKWHDMSGFFVFVVAVLLMMGVQRVLETDVKAKVVEWKNAQKAG